MKNNKTLINKNGTLSKNIFKYVIYMKIIAP